MGAITALMSAFDVLEGIQSDLAAIAPRTDDARRFELIKLRKRLVEQVLLVGRMAEAAFQPLDDPDLLREYRSRFSRMRSAAALHQANWPAVRVGEADEEYQSSVRCILDANAHFSSWLRSTAAELGRR